MLRHPATILLFFLSLSALRGEQPPKWVPEGVVQYYGPERTSLAPTLHVFDSRDGTNIYTIHSDRISVWDRQSGKFVRSVGILLKDVYERNNEVSHTDSNWDAFEIRAAAMLHDRNRIAVWTGKNFRDGANLDIGLMLIDAENVTRMTPIPLKGDRDESARRIAVSSDSARLLVQRNPDQLSVIETKGGKSLWSIKLDQRHIGSAALSPDGKIVAIARTGAAIEFIEIDKPGTFTNFPLEERTERISAMEFSPDGKTLCVASPGRLTLVAAETPKTLAAIALPREGDWNVNAAFSPDGKRILARFGANRVAIIDVQQRKRIEPMPEFVPIEGTIAFARDSKTLIAGSPRVGYRLWSAETLKEISAPRGHMGLAFGAAAMRDGNRIIIFGQSPAICEWDRTSGRLISQTNASAPAGSSPLILARDERTLLACDEQGRTVWHDIQADKTLLVEHHAERASALALSGDQKSLLAVGPGFQSRIVDTASGKLLWDESGVDYGGQAAISNTDGTRFFVGNKLGYVTCLDARSGKRLWHTRVSIRSISKLALASKDSRVFAADAGGQLFVLSADKGASHGRIDLAGGAIADLAVSPDQEVLAIAKDMPDLSTKPWRASITLIEAESGNSIVSFSGQCGPIVSVMFSPDGIDLYSVSRAGYMLRWQWLPKFDVRVEHPRELEFAWALLGDRKADFAYGAMEKLAQNADAALRAFAKANKKSDEVLSPAIRDLVQELDHPRFAVRERAKRQLALANWWAKDDLEVAREKSRSEETRARAEQLLRDIPEKRSSDEQLRRKRTCAVLERIATPEAIAILKNLASEWPEAKAIAIKPKDNSDSFDLRQAILRRGEK